MASVLVYGAGSIGNHLSHACRTKGWEVVVCDIDQTALKRMKEDIYPERYGSWDDEIQLTMLENVPDKDFEVIIIGTPPDAHFKIALDVLKKHPPKVLLIEKPLCSPSLEGAKEVLELSHKTETCVLVGYNHVLMENTIFAKELFSKGNIGDVLTISAKFREYWGGIFAAHPWLSGPDDTYLGFSERGGGASGEHSHAINIWQSFAHHINAGRIVEVSAMLDMVDDGKVLYDRICQLSVKTESGLVGNIVQDVITEPSQKNLRMQGTKGFIEWHVNYSKGKDAVVYGDSNGNIKEEIISKARPQDFIGEINHIGSILNGDIEDSPISLERGLETMLVICAAHLSHKYKKVVSIDYTRGLSSEAIIL